MANVVQFNYDGQMRRFILQFIRMVSNFQVEFGKDTAGNRTLQTVPVYYGDPSRQASTILKNNSENALSTVPAMSVYISALRYDRDRLQNPYHESDIRIREQVYDQATQQYTGTQDGQYTVKRFMPAPYTLGMKLDIWTSNTDQKHQLIEQLVPLFNPGFEIQSTDNYVDWTSLSVALLTNVNYTSRSVPMMSDDTSIDIATLEFEIPIWLTLPAKVQKGGVVQQIIANIYDESGGISGDILNMAATTQIRYSPLDYPIVYASDSRNPTGLLTLYSATTADGSGTTADWPDLINLYGKLINGISQVRLTFDYPDGQHEVVGVVAYNPGDPTSLLFTPHAETQPANTITPNINAIIDPFTVNINNTPYGTSGNANGTQNLLSPATNTRYLILNPIGNADNETGAAWAGISGTNLIANANDIIQYNGEYWTVVFDSQSSSAVEYVTNMNTNVQYRWDGKTWIKAIDGIYRGGSWSLIL